MTADKPSHLVPKRRFPEFAQGPGWDHAKVADLVETVTPPKKLTTSTYLAHGRFPIIDQSPNYICGWTNDKEAVITRPLPVIVFGDHTCVLKFVNRPFAQGADGIKILSARRRVSTVYLYHQLAYRPVVMEEYKRHFSTLKDKVICFPDPKSGEQQKIADCLGSLDDLIAAEGRKLEALREHKQGLMQQLFPQPGETAPRLRFPEFVNAAWESKTLGTLVSDTERPIVMDDETEYALVTVKRRYGGVVARKVLKGKAINVKSQFLIEANDFLVSKRQIVHDACGLVPAELAGSIVSNEYSVLTAKNGCDIEFFNYFTQQPCVSDSFLQSSVGIVIEKMLFKLDWWLKLTFPFPSFAEQQRIAACVSSLDARLASQAQKLDGLKRHKQGLLQQLFPSLEEETR